MPQNRRRGSRAGVTLVELLVVVAIVGILVGLAIPNVQTVVVRARAAEVAADLDVVRVAVVQYNADANRWPPETPTGVIPGELTDYLPEGFSFQRRGYELDFQRVNMSDGLPGDPSTRMLIGVAVTTETSELGNAVAQLLRGSILSSTGNTHTVVIDRM